MTRIIKSRFIPPRGFAAITLFGMVVTRDLSYITPRTLRHEQIHCRQQLEWLYIPFFVLYILEWLWHLARLRDPMKAYYAISFEREAYDNDHDLTYLSRRRPYANYRRRR